MAISGRSATVTIGGYEIKVATLERVGEDLERGAIREVPPSHAMSMSLQLQVEHGSRRILWGDEYARDEEARLMEAISARMMMHAVLSEWLVVMCATPAFRASGRPTPSLSVTEKVGIQGALGTYDRKRHMVSVDPRQRSHVMLATLAHEVAHAMGHPLQVRGPSAHTRTWERNFAAIVEQTFGRRVRPCWNRERRWGISRRVIVDEAAEYVAGCATHFDRSGIVEGATSYLPLPAEIRREQ